MIKLLDTMAKEKKDKETEFWALGMVLGVYFGPLVGEISQNIDLWLPVGLAIGTWIGFWLDLIYARKDRANLGYD